MKKVLLFSALVAAVIIMQQCKSGGKTDETEVVSPNVQAVVPFKAVPFPDPGVAGFHFPEDSVIITKWINNNQAANIYNHGWGIWTGLNMNSGESYNGEPLRVFETWFTPDDITAAINAQKTDKNFLLEKLSRGRSTLKQPNQAIHAIRLRKLKANGSNIPAPDSSRILGFVKYDPSAAQFTIKNTLYDSVTLQTMLNQGKTAIPDFPNTAITTKPVFNIITQSELVNGYYKLKVWSGPPDKPIGYPDKLWPGCVYVDLNNQGLGNGSIDIGCKGRTPQTTYNVNDFVHFKLDKAGAEEMRKNFKLTSAKEGDIAILVAMHVTSREIKRWTWQTFWWAPNADAPPEPSSKAIASSRPKQLTGAPRHYAMAIAYTFINPDQPYTGGNNKGTSIYAYNPYLEAEFDANVFYEVAKVNTNGKIVTNDVGVRTNCMSCHALANFNPGNAVSTGPGYIADTYIDMEGARFNKVLKLDFLWSIQGNIIEGSGPKTMPGPIK